MHKLLHGLLIPNHWPLHARIWKTGHGFTRLNDQIQSLPTPLLYDSVTHSQAAQALESLSRARTSDFGRIRQYIISIQPFLRPATVT